MQVGVCHLVIDITPGSLAELSSYVWYRSNVHNRLVDMRVLKTADMRLQQ